MVRTLEQSVDIDGPVDQVWTLVSSSEGLSAWFVDAVVVAGHGGSVTLRFGPRAEGTMPIVVWEPPHRIRFGAAEGTPGRAHDIQVAAGRSGGSSVRLIDDGVEDAEADATIRGWAGMLRRLQQQALRP